MQPPFEENSSFSWVDPAPRFDPAGTEDTPEAALKQAIADLEQLRQVHSATLVKLAKAQEASKSKTSDREQQLEAEIELLRSKVIKEMSYVQENYWQKIVRLTDELQGLSRLREHLERELDYRSTTKAAVRQIIKTVLRKLKLFEFIYRRYEAFVPVYNLLFGDRWKPATIAADNAADNTADEAKALTPPIDMDSVWVNALVLARSMGIEVCSAADFERLDRLAALTKTVTTALCIAPVEPHLPLLCALVKQGVEVQCVGCTPSEQHYVRQFEIKTTTQSLTDWMMTTPDVCLADYQVICLDSTSRALHMDRGDVTDVLHLLRGHLSPNVQIVFSRTTA